MRGMAHGPVPNCSPIPRTVQGALAWVAITLGTLGLSGCSEEPDSSSQGSSADASLVADPRVDTDSWSILQLAARIEIPTAGRTEGLTTFDMDQDGAHELLTVVRLQGADAGALQIFDDVLSPGRSVALPGYPIGPVVWDDGDGPRVAVASRSTNEVLVFDPREPIREVARHTLPARPLSIGVGALRGIGRSTVVVATAGDSLVTIDGERMSTHPLPDGLPTFVRVEPSMVIVGSQADFIVRRFFVDGEDLAPQESEPVGAIPRGWFSTPLGEFLVAGDDQLMKRAAEGWVTTGNAGGVPLDVRSLGGQRLVTLSFVDLALRVWRDGEVHQRIDTGQDPWAFTIGDVNGDDVLDLAVANRALHRISVILGDGQGGWRSGHSVPAGEGPKALAAGDVNGDGHIDVVATNVLDGTLGIHLGDGRGGLAPATLHRVNAGATGVIVRIDKGTATITWSSDPGTGEGGEWSNATWTGDGPEWDQATRHVKPGAIADMITGSDGTTLFQSLPEGNVVVEIPQNMMETQALDFTGHPGPLDERLEDDHSRLLVGVEDPEGAHRVEVWQRVGQERVRVADIRLESPAVDVALANLDQDEALEILTLHRGATDNSPGVVRVFDKAGGTYVESATLATGLRPFAFDVGDVDGDGFDDLVVSAQNSHHLNFWTARDGVLQPQPDLGCGRGPLGVLLVDLDGDGRCEIISANNFSNDLTVIE